MLRSHCHCPKQGSILVFMASSVHLRLHQVRAAYRLVGEVRELGAEPSEWRRHLLEGLNFLVGTQVAMSCEMPAPFDGRMPPPELVVDLGWRGEAERAVWLDFVRHCVVDKGHWYEDPAASGNNRLQAQGRSFTRLRQHFVDDARWYRSPHVMEGRRATGIDGFIVSSRVVSRLGVSNLMVLHRAWGEPLPEEPQRRLVALVHGELGRLWKAAPVQDPRADLAPRLHQVFERLCAGDSEKQVAARLGLSPHTVHNYVKDLHRHFAACSRGELMGHCILRAADFRPRLSRELELSNSAQRTPGPDPT
jgi:DNA-binding CsgD family transcriptional regulator